MASRTKLATAVHTVLFASKDHFTAYELQQLKDKFAGPDNAARERSPIEIARAVDGQTGREQSPVVIAREVNSPKAGLRHAIAIAREVNSPGAVAGLCHAINKFNEGRKTRLWARIRLPLSGWEIASEPNRYTKLSSYQAKYRTFKDALKLDDLRNEELDFLVVLAYCKVDPLCLGDFRSVQEKCSQQVSLGSQARRLLRSYFQRDKFLSRIFGGAVEGHPRNGKYMVDHIEN